jgi:hypothetical protein
MQKSKAGKSQMLQSHIPVTIVIINSDNGPAD